MAALRSPSSNLDETAWASKVVGDATRVPAGLAGLGKGSVVGRNSEMCFFITFMTLWRLPPRLGGCSTRPLQLNKDSQLALSSGLATIARKILAKWVAHADQADLGICFITMHSTGVHHHRLAEDDCVAATAWVV